MLNYWILSESANYLTKWIRIIFDPVWIRSAYIFNDNKWGWTRGVTWYIAIFSSYKYSWAQSHIFNLLLISKLYGRISLGFWNENIFYAFFTSTPKESLLIWHLNSPLFFLTHNLLVFSQFPTLSKITCVGTHMIIVKKGHANHS